MVSVFRQPTLDTWIDPEDGRVYTDIPAYALPVAPIRTPPSPEWSSDEDQFLEVGAQLELHGSILHDNTQRLDALLPTLFTDIDRDVRELYNRSRADAMQHKLQDMRGRVTALEQEMGHREQ
ncbi:hypothetical protein Tco_1285546 [Tanacetum coccineum]